VKKYPAKYKTDRTTTPMQKIKSVIALLTFYYQVFDHTPMESSFSPQRVKGCGPCCIASQWAIHQECLISTDHVNPLLRGHI